MDLKVQQLKQQMISVYEDTKMRIGSNEHLMSSVRQSIENQQFFCEEEAITLPEPPYDKRAHVMVSNLRTFTAAAKYQDQKVAVLNFACAVNPGGGVTIGALGQEESLCRASTLSFCLDNPSAWDFYYTPNRNAHNLLHNDNVIYTKSVVIIKDDDYTPLSTPFFVDVITCAAPNLQEQPSNSFYYGDPVLISRQDLLELHEKRARKILSVAALNNVDVLILGAFGCGAFCNEPDIVAKAYRMVLHDYQYYFKYIEFAVFGSPSNQTNYLTFNEILGTW